MSASTSRPPRARLLTAAGVGLLGAAVLLAGTGAPSGQAIAAQPVSAPLAPVASPAADLTRTGPEASASRTALQILRAARKKGKAATSVRVRATIKDEDGVFRTDIRMTRSGKATGTLSTPEDGSMKLILVSRKKGFFKPGEDMLDKVAEGDEAVRSLLAGRWFAFDRDDDFNEAFQMTRMKTYSQDIFVLSGPKRGLYKVKGQKVRGYTKTVGLREKGWTGTLLIAADGTNRLAAFRDSQSRFTFSRWNRKVKVKAPANPLDIDDFTAAVPADALPAR